MREANTLPYYERTPSGLNERLCAVEKKMMDMKPMKNMTDYMEPLHEGGCDCAVCDDIEMRNHLKQITQTANNFYDAWSSLYDHCKELAEINQRLEAEYSAKVVELTGRNDFYRRMLQDIVSVGESDSNFPQDGRMYDIAKAALEMEG